MQPPKRPSPVASTRSISPTGAGRRGIKSAGSHTGSAARSSCVACDVGTPHRLKNGSGCAPPRTRSASATGRVSCRRSSVARHRASPCIRRRRAGRLPSRTPAGAARTSPVPRKVPASRTRSPDRRSRSARSAVSDAGVVSESEFDVADSMEYHELRSLGHAVAGTRRGGRHGHSRADGSHRADRQDPVGKKSHRSLPLVWLWPSSSRDGCSGCRFGSRGSRARYKGRPNKSGGVGASDRTAQVEMEGAPVGGRHLDQRSIWW